MYMLLLKNADVPARPRRRKAAEVAMVVNPNSAGGLTGSNWDDLYAKIQDVFGAGVKVAFSKGPGGGTAAARDLLRQGFARIVAMGGDGTINEVANGFFEEVSGIRSRKLWPINPDAAMGIVPSGTRNVLARSLGLPEGIDECLLNFVRGRPLGMDVIAVSATDPDHGTRMPPRILLNAAEMGVGAEIIDRSKKVRNRVKSRLVSTVAAIISTVPAYESNLCDFFIDGRKKATNMTMGIVANGKFLGGGFMVAPEASVSDGLLDLVVLKDSGSLKILDDLAGIKRGNYAGGGNILYAKARKVLIKSRERNVTVTIDGEPVGVLPASFQVFPKALRVVT